MSPSSKPLTPASPCLFLLRQISKLYNKVTSVNPLMISLNYLLNPITLWVKSENGTLWRLLGQHVQTMLDTLWSSIEKAMKKTGFDEKMLEKLTAILVVGFKNKNRHIKNSTVTFWNNTFGKAKQLIYPTELKVVLSSLYAKNIPITLPSWTSMLSHQSVEPSADLTDTITMPVASVAFPDGSEILKAHRDPSQSSEEETVSVLSPKINLKDKKHFSNPGDVKNATKGGYVPFPSKKRKKSIVEPELVSDEHSTKKPRRDVSAKAKDKEVDNQKNGKKKKPKRSDSDSESDKKRRDKKSKKESGVIEAERREKEGRNRKEKEMKENEERERRDKEEKDKRRKEKEETEKEEREKKEREEREKRDRKEREEREKREREEREKREREEREQREKEEREQREKEDRERKEREEKEREEREELERREREERERREREEIEKKEREEREKRERKEREEREELDRKEREKKEREEREERERKERERIENEEREERERIENEERERKEREDKQRKRESREKKEKELREQKEKNKRERKEKQREKEKEKEWVPKRTITKPPKKKSSTKTIISLDSPQREHTDSDPSLDREPPIPNSPPEPYTQVEPNTNKEDSEENLMNWLAARPNWENLSVTQLVQIHGYFQGMCNEIVVHLAKLHNE